ncbi:MAG TPA: hypothetical protein VNX25_10565 [Verrucomicrobiae bacterium]|nr:hypothetical protein [Verrucomicrobiae bacterium]
MHPLHPVIHVLQALLDDASVTSVQWVTLPGSAPQPQELLARYLEHVRSCTLGIVRPAISEGTLRFRVAGTRLSLLEFALPPGAPPLPLPITGGLLAGSAPEGTGTLEFSVRRGRRGSRMAVRLCGYHPALLGRGRPRMYRKLLYGLTQAYIHRLVTVSFLRNICRTCGSRPVVTVVRPKKGEPI